MEQEKYTDLFAGDIALDFGRGYCCKLEHGDFVVAAYAEPKPQGAGKYCHRWDCAKSSLDPADKEAPFTHR